MRILVFLLAVSLTACTATPPKKPDFRHAPIENINHDIK